MFYAAGACRYPGGKAGDLARGLVPRPVAIGDPPDSFYKICLQDFTLYPHSSTKAALRLSTPEDGESNGSHLDDSARPIPCGIRGTHVC